MMMRKRGKIILKKSFSATSLKRKGLKYKWSYNKISSSHGGKKVNEKVRSLLENDINILVFNFVDMLSHARTDIGVIRDLANDERAYRSLTRSWFIHSSLFELLKTIASHQVKVIFSTDHGTIRVQNPVKIIGDRKTSSNLRYKMGRNLDYDPRKVFELKNPEKAMLPKTNISSRYIFALNKDFLVYQNNYNHYAGYYKDTFQHGGISMQEIMLPCCNSRTSLGDLMEIIIKDKKHLHAAARELLKHSGENKIFAFYGSMGAGKTTIIKAICEVLGAIDIISSPTFTLVNEYRTASRRI